MSNFLPWKSHFIHNLLLPSCRDLRMKTLEKFCQIAEPSRKKTQTSVQVIRSYQVRISRKTDFIFTVHTSNIKSTYLCKVCERIYQSIRTISINCHNNYQKASKVKSNYRKAASSSTPRLVARLRQIVAPPKRSNV